MRQNLTALLLLFLASCGQTTLQLRATESEWKDCSQLPISETIDCGVHNAQICEAMRNGQAVARLKDKERIADTNTVRYTYEICLTPKGDPDTRLSCFGWYDEKSEPSFLSELKDRSFYVLGGAFIGGILGYKVGSALVALFFL